MKLNKGFTLIEAVVVITLISILSFGIGNFIITSIKAWVLISQRDAALNMGRMAMNRMVAEIRSINKASGITTNISIANPTTECAFYNINGNYIKFTQSGIDLLRFTGAASSDVLATGLSTPNGLIFTFLNSSATNDGVQANISTVRIWLSLSSSTQQVTLESSARIRNL